MASAKSEGVHGFSSKDLLSLGVSLAALLISGIGAYYNFFYQRISVNALIDEPYPQYDFVRSTMTDIAFRPIITVINEGNKPVALLGMTVVTREWAKLPSKENVCHSKHGKLIAHFFNHPTLDSFAPTVIPPASVVVLQPGFVEPMRSSPMIAAAGEIIPQTISPDKHVSSCIRIELAAPDRGRVQVELPLSRQTLHFDGGAERFEAYSEGSLLNLID